MVTENSLRKNPASSPRRTDNAKALREADEAALPRADRGDLRKVVAHDHPAGKDRL
jgi:hypothetical protein